MKSCFQQKAFYEYGKIILIEEPPVKTKADVMVAFLLTEIIKA